MFLDVDGTLIDLAAAPHRATAPPGLGPLLRRLARRLDGALAIVTGRALADLDRMLPLPGIAVAGQHGAELRWADGRLETATRPPALDAVARGLRDRGLGSSPLLLEDKGASLAVHFRAAPARGPDVRAAFAELASESGGLELIDGHFVCELRAREIGKDRAVAALMGARPFRGRMPVFVGDDATDRDGFAEVERRGGLAVQVRPIRFGRPALFLRGPKEVRRWLTALLGPRRARDTA